MKLSGVVTTHSLSFVAEMKGLLITYILPPSVKGLTICFANMSSTLHIWSSLFSQMDHCHLVKSFNTYKRYPRYTKGFYFIFIHLYIIPFLTVPQPYTKKLKYLLVMPAVHKICSDIETKKSKGCRLLDFIFTLGSGIPAVSNIIERYFPVFNLHS